ncbi:MAG: hypothetical protein GY853_15005 [PVC group bacterium]|nr:hypothetical protein [PVC group bacterium]
MLIDAYEDAQSIDMGIPQQEIDFMNNHAIPILDDTFDEDSLKDMADIFWNLCLWEKGRADILDTKASYLLGLSSIAAAVIAVGGLAKTDISTPMIWAGGFSLLLFVLTVIASLYTLLGRLYGGFSDIDIFDALRAYRNPVGNINEFKDNHPRRCFLKELTLQRWMIRKSYNDVNNERFKILKKAQILALSSVASLIIYLLIAILIPNEITFLKYISFAWKYLNF